MSELEDFLASMNKKEQDVGQPTMQDVDESSKAQSNYKKIFGSPESPSTKEYMGAKENLGAYNVNNDRLPLLEKVQDSMQPPHIGAGFAALGAGLQGYNPVDAGLHYLAHERKAKTFPLEQYDIQRKQAGEDLANQKNIYEYERSSFDRQRREDPNSSETMLAREIARSMGMDPKIADQITAAQFKAHSPAFEKMMQVKAMKDLRDKALSSKAIGGPSGTGPYSTVNQEFEKEIAKYISNDKAQMDTAIKELDDLMLEINMDIPGNAYGGGTATKAQALAGELLLPKKYLDRRSVAQNIGLRALKPTFTGSTSKEELEVLQKSYWNDRFTNAQQYRNLQRHKSLLEARRAYKEKALQYYNKNKTLDGFPIQSFTPADYRKALQDGETSGVDVDELSDPDLHASSLIKKFQRENKLPTFEDAVYILKKRGVLDPKKKYEDITKRFNIGN